MTTVGVDSAQLATELEARFDGSDRAVRVVSRHARDLADSGCLAEDGGYEPPVATIVEHLEDAPEGYTLVERWNWWIGSLVLAYGDEYRQFRVRASLE